MGECDLKIALAGTVGMRVTLRQRGRKDCALLNADFPIIKTFLGFFVWRWFFKCGASWSLEVPSDGDLLWFFVCGWSGSRPESQPLQIL